MESETAKRLCDRLRDLRGKRELTQEAFAQHAGFGYKYYQAVEAGRKADLRLSTLEKLAKGHGLQVWELLVPAELFPAVAEAQSKWRRSPRPRPTKKDR